MSKKREGEQAAPVEKKITKADLLRSAFDEKDTWTVDELLERTGYDEQNLRVSVGFLKNPKRTKPESMIELFYDKAARVYSSIKPVTSESAAA